IAQHGGALTHLSVYEPARAPITSFAVQVAEVTVEPATGQVKVNKLTTVHDSGTVLNHLSYTGQIDGGIINGLGFALMEDNSLIDGTMPTVNLGEFKMANIADLPKLTTVLMESPAGPIPYQGKAIAEIPNVPTAAAIANAVQDACSVRILDLPITAEKVYGALKN
ncbi:MAG TPA: molybdopterin cofactor-binding domain-containing protein, partial [Candidatus Limnocylindrales bacterium]|nr:molybdopterin cofactor-binding domain-containing protein [Candidatus Limnocylindrales bacterium]